MPITRSRKTCHEHFSGVRTGLAAGAFLVQAAESGSDKDIQRATDGLLRAIELEGWMNRVHAAAPSIAGQHLAAEATEVTTECSAPSG